jgi:hypothetical protein
MNINNYIRKNYLNIDNYEINNNNFDYLAIIIYGQMRTFNSVLYSLQNTIDMLKKKFKNVILFLYVSLDSTIEQWALNDYVKIKHLNKEHCQEEIKKYKILPEECFNILQNINCEKYIYIKKSCNYETCRNQLNDLYNCLQLVSSYEKTNNIQFDFIFKSRFDYEYKNNFDLHIFDTKIIYIHWDIIFTFSREISKIFENNLNNIIENFYIYINLLLKEHYTVTQNIENETMYIKHFMIFMLLIFNKDIEIKNISIGDIKRMIN